MTVWADSMRVHVRPTHSLLFIDVCTAGYELLSVEWAWAGAGHPLRAESHSGCLFIDNPGKSVWIALPDFRARCALLPSKITLWARE